jgi:hypothetical protein
MLGSSVRAYESCDWDEEVFCDVNDCAPPDAVQDLDTGLYSFVRTYVLPNLNVGDDYYVFLDGCGGSVCDYTVKISGTGAAFTPEFHSDPNPPIDCDNCDDINDLCVGSTVNLIPLDEAGEEYDLSLSYNWEITTPGGNIFDFFSRGK